MKIRLPFGWFVYQAPKSILPNVPDMAGIGTLIDWKSYPPLPEPGSWEMKYNDLQQDYTRLLGKNKRRKKAFRQLQQACNEYRENVQRYFNALQAKAKQLDCLQKSYDLLLNDLAKNKERIDLLEKEIDSL